jgi:hypothetical protein
MKYFFRTTWELPAPVSEVWDLIHDAERWPEWWKGVLKVEKIRQGDADDVGSVFIQTWKSALPYTLSFTAETTKVEHHKLIEGTASGQLEGIGRWIFTPRGNETTLVYEWEVKTTSTWMNLLGPLLKPAFSWNHNIVMRWGKEGILKRLSR